MTLTPNRPTPEGRALGAELARLIEPEIARLKATYGQDDDRCTSCAFRLGAIPNGCPGTLMDALKCAMEGHVFVCHEKSREGRACYGWVAAAVGMGPGTREMPWPWASEPESAA